MFFQAYDSQLAYVLLLINLQHLAEGAHVIRGEMSSGESKKFDKKNGARGINLQEVVKIAQRNGVYPNKYGVLLAEPNSKIMEYVQRYANSQADVEEFRRQWYLTIHKQLEKKHEKIRNENKNEYNRLKNYYETAVIPYLGNDVVYLEINHWMFMPRDIHEQRMQEIVKKTVFGKFVKSSALRVNHRIDVEGYVEYYELRLPKNGNMHKYEFRKLYMLSCSHLGCDHQM